MKMTFTILALLLALFNNNVFSSIPRSLLATSLTDFGNVYTNSTLGPNTFTITGTNLDGINNVTVGALSGFTYCTTSGGSYTTTLSFSSAPAAKSPTVLPGFSQVIYVKFSPTAVQSYNGNIVVGGGGAPSINVAATGSGISPCTGPGISSQLTAAQTQCAGGTFTTISVIATGTGLSYQWFSNATADTTGMTSLGSANGAQADIYTPQSTTAGTLYYYCLASGTCGEALSAVSGAFVTNSLTPPPAPAASGVTICSGSTATLSATGSGTLSWYNAATGGTWLHTGSTYTSPALSASATYYVQDSTCAASATRTAVIVGISNICVSSPLDVLTFTIGSTGSTISDLHTSLSGNILTITATNLQNLLALDGAISAGITSNGTSTVIVDLSTFSTFAGISVVGGSGTDNVTIGTGGINLSTVSGGASAQSVLINIGSSNDQLTIANAITAKGAGNVYLKGGLSYEIAAPVSAASDTLTLISDGTVTQTAALSATRLILGKGTILSGAYTTITNAGRYILKNSLNDVINLSACTSDSINYNDFNALTINGAGAMVGGNFTVTAGGNLELSGSGYNYPASTGNISLSTTHGTVLVGASAISSGGDITLSSADSTVTVSGAGIITKGNFTSTSYRNFILSGGKIDNTSGTGDMSITSSNGSVTTGAAGLVSKGIITLLSYGDISLGGAGINSPLATGLDLTSSNGSITNNSGSINSKGQITMLSYGNVSLSVPITNSSGTGVVITSTHGTVGGFSAGLSSKGDVSVQAYGDITLDGGSINNTSGTGNLSITSTNGILSSCCAGLQSKGKVTVLTYGNSSFSGGGIGNSSGLGVHITSSNGTVNIQDGGVSSKDTISVEAEGNISLSGSGANNSSGAGPVNLHSHNGIISVTDGGVNAKNNAVVQSDKLTVLFSLNSNNKKVSVFPANPNVSIDLGGSDATQILGITNTELSKISADSVSVGDLVNTANIVVSSKISDALHKMILVTRPSGGISLSDSLKLKDVDISNVHKFSTTILSRNSARIMSVTGSVQLGINTVLELSTSATGFIVGDSIKIIDNALSDAISGTFSGLAQNDTLSLLDGSGTRVYFRISYSGGDGNDAILRVINSCFPPAAPTANGDTICSGSTATLSATSTGTLSWYDASSGGTWLHSGSNFETPELYSSNTYYVQDSTCAASATRTSVEVTVDLPIAPINFAISAILSGINGPAAGLAFDASGNMYSANVQDSTISKFAAGTMAASTFVDKSAQLDGPVAMAFDATGNMYITCKNDSTIRKVTPLGVVSTFVTSGAGLKAPVGIDIDSQGNLYVANLADGSIKKVTPGGVVSTIVDSTGLNKRLPVGVRYDGLGHLYVGLIATGVSGSLSGVQGTIIKIQLTDNSITTFVDVTKGLSFPAGLRFDGEGNLYVADLTSAFKKITPDGTVTSIVSIPYFGGVAYDSHGSLYVSYLQAPFPFILKYELSSDVCLGSATQFIDLTSNGIWSSSDSTIARVDSSSGMVTAMAVGTATISYTVAGSSTSCNNSVTHQITVHSEIPAAPAASGVSICSGNTAKLSATGTGTLSWYDAASAGNLLHTGSTYTTPALTVSASFYVQDSTCSVSATRTKVEITVRPLFSSGAIASTGETLCYNGNPAEIGNTVAASGGDASISYQWQKSTTSSSADFSVIDLATTANYDPPTGLTVNTWYRRLAKDGACDTTFTLSTGVWKVSIETTAPSVVTKNITRYLDASGNATIVAADIDNGSTDNCSITSRVASKTSFNCADKGANTVALTVTDAAGNSASANATVTVVDAILPTAVAKNITLNLNPAGMASIEAADINNGSSDNCTFTLAASKTTFNCTNLGANNVTLTVTDASGNLATAVSVVTVVESSALPSPFVAALIGSSFGTATYSKCNLRYTLTAKGYSSPNADVHESVYRPLTGNGSIVVRVLDITGGGWAGVQIRESSAPGAKKVLLKTQFQTMIRSELRLSTGGAHSSTQISRQGIKWLKLVRTGNRFDAYTSVDGIGWRSAFSTSFTMASTVQVGFLTESLNNTTTTQARFDNVSVTTGPAKSLEANATSVVGNALDTSIEIYPNPARDFVTVEIPDIKTKVQVSVYSAEGKMVHTEMIEQVTTQMDVSYLKPGVYIVRFDSDGEIVPKRLVVY